MKENSFPSLTPGTVFYDKYEILYVIGQGGTGRVYKARDINSHDTIWVIKEIFSMEGSSAVQEIFQREASMLSSLKHKNIPKIKEYFIIDPAYYIVMEYIDGKTLQEIYTAGHRVWTEKELAKLGIPLCDVLEYLHEHSVVFRDLKPKNIIIDENNVPKLIDFGIARHFSPDQTEDTMKIGTVGYAAPEQYGKKGGGSDDRTDIYALGVLLHYLATGDDPEEKKDPFYFIPVRDVNIDISEDFEELINKCIKFRKDERFDSVSEIKKKLQKIHCRLSPDYLIQKGRITLKRPEECYLPSPPPEGSRITIIEEDMDRYIVNIVPEGITLRDLLPGLLWITLWTAVLIAVMIPSIKDFTCFVIFWLYGEFMGILTMINLITSKIGHVRLTFDREYMNITVYWLGRFPVERIYPLPTLSNLSLSKYPEADNKKYLMLPYAITVNSGDKIIYLPFYGKKDENRWLYGEIGCILSYLGGQD